jgi:hypothetical protein
MNRAAEIACPDVRASASSSSWIRRLLAVLPVATQRPASLDPRELAPHLLRDIGLSEHGFAGEDASRMRAEWPAR